MKFTEIRNRIIEKDYEHLNNMQKSAVFNTSGPLLVIAGAGSGKTTVIINKIGHLIKYGSAYGSEYVDPSMSPEEEEVLEWYANGEVDTIPRDLERFLSVDPIKPYNILAITFTNKAAAELKSRITARLGDCGEDVWASTFHSMCVRFLRRDIEKIGYNKNFAIFDTADQQTVIKECLKELDIDEKAYSPRSVLSVISRAKDELLDCDDFEQKFAGDFYREKVAEIYRLYQRKLKSYNALDFDDIIFNTVRLFEENGEVLEYYQDKFKYILVDEYQDTNSAQYRLISLLAGKHHNICVVGDDDQSIYKFRGANIQNILSFEKDFKGAEVIKLEENYRSTQNILGAANSVIKNNDGRRGKSLWTQNDEGEKVVIYNAENEHDEGYFIARTIEKNMPEEDTAYNDYAVLYRMNAQSRVIEECLMRNAIPYRVIGGLRFYDRKEIKDLTAYLRLIQNTEDNVALKRIINEPKRGIGGTTVDKIEDIAADTGVSMFEVCRRASEFDGLSRAASKITAFAEMIDGIISKRTEQNLEELVHTVLEESRMISALNADNTVESRTRIENLNEFISMVQEEMKNDELITLDELLEKISLVSDIDNYNEMQDTVVLMTLHSAKGLEFPYVFLVGVEEGVFPGNMALGNPDEMEEERRLCYVGITRAKKKLYITHARSRMLFGRTTYNPPSRFIGEISKEFTENLSPRNGRRSSESSYRPREIVKGFGSSLLINNGKTHAERQYSEPSDSAFSFKAGDKVRHRKFGVGTVTSVTSMGRDMLVVVDFENDKGKRLMATYARLEKVE